MFSPSSTQEAVGLVVQLLQSCVVPIGTVAPSDAPTDVGDYTQWGVVRDHTGRSLYAFTAANPTLLRVDVAALCGGSGSLAPPAGVPVVQPHWFADITGQFANA